MTRGIPRRDVGQPQLSNHRSGSKGEVLKSKVDSCAKCAKRVMANLEMYTKCGKWVHGR